MLALGKMSMVARQFEIAMTSESQRKEPNGVIHLQPRKTFGHSFVLLDYSGVWCGMQVWTLKMHADRSSANIFLPKKALTSPTNDDRLGGEAFSELWEPGLKRYPQTCLVI